MTALIEVDRARRDFFYATRKYVPLIMDGGIKGSADMIIALTIADALMLGGYLNHFYEAAGEKIGAKGETTREDEIYEVAAWGEGSARAQNLGRYGQSRKTFFEEGVEGTTLYWGRLKPRLKSDLLKIMAAMSNAGCMDLEEFRAKSRIELLSQHSAGIVTTLHSIKVKGE